MKKIFLFLFSLLIVGSFSLSAVTKLSFKDYCNDEEKQKKAVLSGISQAIPGKEESAGNENEEETMAFSSSIKSLLKAELIAEVEPVGKTKWEHQAALCTLKVKKVFKGDVKPDELIDFYETSFFNIVNKDELRFFNASLFTPMKEGNSYIVFGNRKDFHPLYEQKLERKVFVQKGLDISWFQTEMTEPAVLSEDKEYTYGEIKDLEFLCSTKEQRSRTIDFKKEMLSVLSEM